MACIVAGVGLAVRSVARVRSAAGLVAEAVATFTGVSRFLSGVFVALGSGVAVILGVAVIVAVGVLGGGRLVWVGWGFCSWARSISGSGMRRTVRSSRCITNRSPDGACTTTTGVSVDGIVGVAVTVSGTSAPVAAVTASGDIETSAVEVEVAATSGVRVPVASGVNVSASTSLVLVAIAGSVGKGCSTVGVVSCCVSCVAVSGGVKVATATSRVLVGAGAVTGVSSSA